MQGDVVIILCEGRIIISDEESQAPWQQRDYKVFSPSVTMSTVDFSSAPAITDLPVTSYICSHEHGQSIKSGTTTLKGISGLEMFSNKVCT